MQNLIKNKFFIIINLTICLFAIFTFSYVNASNNENVVYNNDDGDIQVILPSGLGTNYNYYLITACYSGGNHQVLVFCSNSYFKFYPQTDGSYNKIINTIDGSPFYFFSKSQNISLPYDFSSSIVDFNNPTSNCKTSDVVCVASNSFLCNTNVYDNNNNLVFQAPPQQVEEVNRVELMKPTQVQEIPQQIVAIVMIVLPIFLGIFGVLLVLYLIKSKNLLQL